MLIYYLKIVRHPTVSDSTRLNIPIPKKGGFPPYFGIEGIRHKSHKAKRGAQKNGSPDELPFDFVPNGFFMFPLCYLPCRTCGTRLACGAGCSLGDNEVKDGGGRGAAVGHGGLRTGVARGHRAHGHGRRRSVCPRRARRTRRSVCARGTLRARRTRRARCPCGARLACGALGAGGAAGAHGAADGHRLYGHAAARA